MSIAFFRPPDELANRAAVPLIVAGIWDVGMWTEGRPFLAAFGGAGVTVLAFGGLFLFGVRLIHRDDSPARKTAAGLVLGASALWLLLVLAGEVRSNLAGWSPLAVMLLALGIEIRSARISSSRSDPQADTRAEAGGAKRSGDGHTCTGAQPDPV
jgi:hypothetical protein